MAQTKTRERGRSSAQWIESTKEHEERKGRTLATRNHEVIKSWASKRKATPATVPGTEHDGRPGVLRFDFPGYGGRGLKKISWDEWFRTFDENNLALLHADDSRFNKLVSR
jgi:hypothetical protein